MRNISTLVFGAALAAAAAVGLSRAQMGAPAAPQTGKVIILDHEGTMTGDIERDGPNYRVRRLNGEVSVPATRVLRLCASMEEAFQFLRGRAALNDPDERLRLAEWAKQHGLRPQALAEYVEASRMRPDDARLRRLVLSLREALNRPAGPATPPPPPAHRESVDVTEETMNKFAVQVQPILMNACANCHCDGRAPGFRLIRSWSAGSQDRRSLSHNLATAVAHIDPRDVPSSRLLRKAISVHADGMTSAPLKGKQLAAFQTLERWVRQVVAENPNFKAAPTPPPSAVAVTPPPPPAGGAPSAFGEGRPAPKAEEKRSDNGPGSPDDFNRENHGERTGGPGDVSSPGSPGGR